MKNRKTANDNQLPLFEDPTRELLKALAGAQLDNLTPVRAFDLLRQWKEKWGK
jgi:hypothetical protein